MVFNLLNAKLNPLCHLLALLGAHHILHITRIRVKQEYKQPKWQILVFKNSPYSSIMSIT
jgi:hypothetical protein